MIIHETMPTLHINTFIEDYLRTCGIQKIESYLYPTPSALENPGGYLHMEQGHDIFMGYRDGNKSISILVDCDCDGLFSAAIMARFCRYALDIVPSFILHQDDELKTHGLSDPGVMQTLLSNPPNLLIIPDAGSNNTEECKILKENGVEDIIVLDHHPITKPNPHATVINNQAPLQSVSNHSLSGAGVAYKFTQYICNIHQIPQLYELDLVAFSILSDVCDLRSIENRYIIYKGLMNIQNPGLQTLVREFIKDDNVTPKNVVWNIVPKLNAMMRFNDSDLKLKVLAMLSYPDCEHDIPDIMKELKSVHRKQSKISKEQSEKLIAESNIKAKVAIVDGSECEPTFTGLIAGKIADKIKKPTLVVREHETCYKGSVRTDDVHFFSACENSGLFDFVAGHPQAFGFKFPKANKDKLEKFFDTLDLSCQTEYTVVKAFDGKNIPLQLFGIGDSQEEIWGKGVEYPMFAIKNIFIRGSDIQEIGRNKTTLVFQYKNVKYIKFFCSQSAKEALYVGKDVNIDLTVIGKLTINEFNGSSSNQVVIEEFEATVDESKSDTTPDWHSIF